MEKSENENSFESSGNIPKGLEARLKRTLDNVRERAEAAGDSNPGVSFDLMVKQEIEMFDLKAKNRSLTNQAAEIELDAAIWKRKYFELLVAKEEGTAEKLSSRQRRKMSKLLEIAKGEEESLRSESADDLEVAGDTEAAENAGIDGNGAKL